MGRHQVRVEYFREMILPNIQRGGETQAWEAFQSQADRLERQTNRERARIP
jgi:hypothetical protein